MGGSPVYLETRKPGKPDRFAPLPVYWFPGFRVYQLYFQNRHHARPHADIDENAFRPGLRGKPISYSVFRIPYCVTTRQNTQYGICTMADSSNPGFANLQ